MGTLQFLPLTRKKSNLVKNGDKIKFLYSKKRRDISPSDVLRNGRGWESQQTDIQNWGSDRGGSLWFGGCSSQILRFLRVSRRADLSSIHSCYSPLRLLFICTGNERPLAMTSQRRSSQLSSIK